MSIEIKGLKEAQEKLQKLSKDAEKLDGQSVSLTDVMTDSFISENSSFGSFNELLEASEFKVESQEDFAAIPDTEWDAFIGGNTNFSNWQEMISSAGALYARKQLGL